MILSAISALLLLLLVFAELAVAHWTFRLLGAAGGQNVTPAHQLLVILGCLAVGCLPILLVLTGLKSAWRTNRTDVGQAILVAGGTLLLMVFASGLSMQEMARSGQPGPSPRATLGQHM